MTKTLTTRFPIPKNPQGQAFGHINGLLDHSAGEPAGRFMLGNNGMWHGGIHITSATTPWCALSGNHPAETPHPGAQPVTCMADGEVVAYRLHRRYLTAPYYLAPGPGLAFSASFLLVRHQFQPGKSAHSGLVFYTLYMHLAPWSAYEAAMQQPDIWQAAARLKTRREITFDAQGNATGQGNTGIPLPKGARVQWRQSDMAQGTRRYGRVTLLDAIPHPTLPDAALQAGEQVWVVVDGDNLRATPGTLTVPGWVRQATRLSADGDGFETVRQVSRPFPIKAGEPVGHLGFYQVPTPHGQRQDYRLHIELISADDVRHFLLNPEKLTHGAQYLKYIPGVRRYQLNAATGNIEPEDQPCRSTGILTLDKAEKREQDGKLFYHAGHTLEHAWLKQGEAQVLSQFDLAALGFTPVEESAAATLNTVQTDRPPSAFIAAQLRHLKCAAQQDTRIDHALVAHNYQRLLDMINACPNGRYNPREFRLAIQNPHLRDALNRLVAWHPSEWYFNSTHPVWRRELQSMEGTFSESVKEWLAPVIDQLIWLHELPGLFPGPSLWHLHPLVFLAAIADGEDKNENDDDEMDEKWLKVEKGQLTFDVEGNDIEDENNTLHRYFSRNIHWPGGMSGVTIGRGYDLGHQRCAFSDLSLSGVKEPLLTWLLSTQGLTGKQASEKLFSAPDCIKKHKISRKQQYMLFTIAYDKLEKDVERICKKAETLQQYHFNAKIAPDEAWSNINAVTKELLVDLRYRGDYTPTVRKHIQSDVYNPNPEYFNKKIADKSIWRNVPRDRYEKRLSYATKKSK